MKELKPLFFVVGLYLIALLIMFGYTVTHKNENAYYYTEDVTYDYFF